MAITWQLRAHPCGEEDCRRRLHGGHMAVTCRVHGVCVRCLAGRRTFGGGYMAVTWRSHAQPRRGKGCRNGRAVWAQRGETAQNVHVGSPSQRARCAGLVQGEGYPTALKRSPVCGSGSGCETADSKSMCKPAAPSSSAQTSTCNGHVTTM